MTDFLTFLNTAELDDLTQIPGISRTLAANIIAARPFDFVEDALHVKGMGKNLLGKAQSYFEAEINAPERRAMIPVPQEAAPAPIEKVRPKEESPRVDGPSFGERMRLALINFMWAFFRLIVIVLTLGVLGVLVYYGLPYLSRTLIEPSQQNAARIEEVSAQVNASQEDISTMQAQMEEISARVDAIDKTIESQSVSLTKLEEMQNTLKQEMKNGDDATLKELQNEIAVTRSIEYLSRARLYLSQSNFGLARTDVQAAHDLIVQVNDAIQSDLLNEVTLRLEMALRNLPDFPVIAVNDVDIAWQMLVSGMKENAVQIAVTPSASNLTPTPEPIILATPTP